MSGWIWVLLVAVVVVVIVAALLAGRDRGGRLRQRFGPEYERTVNRSPDRRTAEAELRDRARRRDRLTIVPLAEPARLAYLERWRGVQEEFVDRPAEAVSAAELLLNRVMAERGYPVSGPGEQADLVSVDHPHVVENYRVAQEIGVRNRDGGASTEDLRDALLRYRSLFEELLRPEGRGDDGASGRNPASGDRSSDRDTASRVNTVSGAHPAPGGDTASDGTGRPGRNTASAAGAARLPDGGSPEREDQR